MVKKFTPFLQEKIPNLFQTESMADKTSNGGQWIIFVSDLKAKV